MMVIYTMHDLYLAAGKHLTGRNSLRLRWQHPAIREYDGTCHLKNGVYYIDIRPDMNDDQRLFAFLHECGHIRSHGTRLTAGLVDHPAASVSLRDSNVKRDSPNVTKTIEEQAEYWRSRWTSYSDKHYRDEQYRGMSEEEARLQSLLNYRG